MLDTVASSKFGYDYLTLVALFASVIFTQPNWLPILENNVRVMVYIRKDVADNSEIDCKEGRTVTNNDYHKVYDAWKLYLLLRVLPSSKEEQ